MNKKFNAWIASNFKGLSCHTLFQFLCMEFPGFPKMYVSDMVYVDLYKVFTKSAHDAEYNAYETVKRIVDNCTWL